MHLSSYPYSIATVVTYKAIEAMLEAGTDGNYKDDHPWLIAKDLFEHASDINQVLPILFASKEQGLDSEYIRFGTIHALFQRRGQSKPSKKEYNQMIRDFNVLTDYKFRFAYFGKIKLNSQTITVRSLHFPINSFW